MERNGSYQRSGGIRQSTSLIWRNDSSQGPFGSTRSREKEDEEETLLWAALERLPTYDRLRKGIMANTSDGVGHQIELQELSVQQRKELVDRLLNAKEADNKTFLKNFKDRIERAGINIPTVEVRFEHLRIEAEAHSRRKTLPTLFNFTTNVLEDLLKLLHIIPTRKCLPILQDISGVVEPKRMTLLLGPPSSGKTTLLLALAGKLDKDLKVSGKVTYNGHGLHEFIPQRTAAYVSQTDLHYGEMTVRETLEYSARFQGVGHRYEMLAELSRREKAAHVKPDPDIDLFMKAAAVGDQKESVLTDYILKILGLEGCADTIVGNEMIRGISGGQKKRVTIGEILVGPATVLLMDEISTGLDSATTFQIVKNLQQFVHILHGTAVISLLQPTPETYNLFDNILLLSDCEIIYQGPHEHVLEFFEFMGFQCPEGKGVADFLQEVISLKDQQQYWVSTEKPYHFIAPKEFARAFKSFHVGEELRHKLANPFDKSKNHPAALVSRKYGCGVKDLLKACFARELLLLKRNSFIYISKLILITILAFVTMTVFLRSKFHKESVTPDGGIYLGAVYSAVMTIFYHAATELPMVIVKLPVFYKQRDLLFFPPWAFSLASWIVKIPISFIDAGVWVFITYYVIGFDPNIQRFFRQFFALGVLHQSATGLYRLVAAVGRNMTVASILCPCATIVAFSLGGFILSYDHVKKWWIWGYWCSPLMYAQNALVVNEFLGQSWRHVLPNTSGPPLGVIVMESRGAFPQAYWYWIGVGALFGSAILYNILYCAALAFLNPFGSHQARNPVEAQKGEQDQRSQNDNSFAQASLDWKIGTILPFEPHSITFDEVWYSIDMPQAMKNQGVLEERLNLLKGVSGSFRPGVLSALMGVSGAGKTTLMDVLAGRKTGGYIEGDVRISGYPKKQETFARISGYCEQNDIHSPHVTVYESLLYSACLRLSPEVNSQTRKMFVQEVMDLVELTPLSGALVGLPGVNGISLEQRKRLTVAVELVANPSIIFMDEPTSGLDARVAAIVMRTVRKIVDTGRTIVCTIHQPSMEIFEAFDEIYLLRQGGQEIYVGPLGHHSSHIISYFESIEGVSKIKEGYSPASWIFEVTTPAQELSLGVDLVETYKKSDLYRRNKALIQELSSPNPGSKGLCFKTQYAQPLSAQLTICIWKQHLMYWRNPPYNAARLFFTIIIALLMGTMFWGLGGKVETRQDLLIAMGSAYAAVLYIGAQNLWTVQPVVAVERVVVYRERSGRMYSLIPYALAQIIIEIPYVLLQSATYSIMVYAMMGFEWTAVKFFSYTFFLFFNLLFFTFFGMVIVVVTPNPYFANVVAFGSLLIWNLFSGFLIPRKMIPIWWRWCYWLCPNAWGLYGLIASQYGDLENVIDSGESVKDFLDEYFGFKHDFLGPVAGGTVGMAVAAAFLFVFSIKAFNFQIR